MIAALARCAGCIRRRDDRLQPPLRHRVTGLLGDLSAFKRPTMRLADIRCSRAYNRHQWLLSNRPRLLNADDDVVWPLPLIARTLPCRIRRRPVLPRQDIVCARSRFIIILIPTNTTRKFLTPNECDPNNSLAALIAAPA